MNIFENLRVPEPIRYTVTEKRELTAGEKAAVKSCIFAARKMGDAWMHVAEFTLHNGEVIRLTATIDNVEPYYTKESEGVYKLNEVPLNLDSIIIATLENKTLNERFYHVYYEI